MTDIPETSTKRVLVVAPNHPSVNCAGSELAAYGVFKGLLEQGCDAVFLAPCRAADRDRLKLGEQEYVFDLGDGEYDVFYHLAAPDLLERAFDAISALTPDVINFHHFIHVGLNTITRVQSELQARVVLTLHEYLAICFHNGQMVTREAHDLCRVPTARSCHSCFPGISRQRFELRRNYILSVLDRCDALISPSHFLASVFKSWGIQTAPLTVIENPLTLPPRVPKNTSTDRTPIFAFFGQITPYKGVEVLLEAVERLDAAAFPYELRIYGNIIPGVDADLAERLFSLDPNGPIKYLGRYENEDVGRLMAECDFIMTPSIWWENSPVVIQEALAVGRPVICSDIGGMAEKVVDGATGWHFKVGDPDDLARVMTLAVGETRDNHLQITLTKKANLHSTRQKYSSVLFSQARSAIAN